MVLRSSQPSPGRRRTLKESGLQTLRNHNYLRTNHFDIDDQLTGLEERLRVLSRDGLADALRENLDALSRVSNKFTPEVLHLLLELADQPVQKSRLEDLELLRQPEEDPGQNLKWTDIAEEDDWVSDRDIWRKVDFRDDSSEDELVDDSSDISDKSEGTSLSSVEAQYRRRPIDLIVHSQDSSVLEQIRKSQSWRHPRIQVSAESGENVVLSELQAVRELLFMIRGISNDLFNSDYRPSATYKLQHASWKSFQVSLSTWGEFGREIYVLRRFAEKEQLIALQQVFRDAIEKRLRNFDSLVTEIEAELVNITQDTVVSLIKVAAQLTPHIQPLCSLSKVIQQLDRETYPHPFRYLELLYDNIIVAQLEGNDLLYGFLGAIFCDCFQVYLRPIRKWMQDGVLLAKDKTFFITEVQSQIPLSKVWDGQFALRRTKDGVLHAPRFLQPAGERIFTTGKSVVILKHLGKYDIDDTLKPFANDAPFTFESLVVPEVEMLAPFSEVFSTGFELWMQGKHHSASAKLRGVLLDSCGLFSILSDLQHVYLMVDGARSDEFAHSLFNNLDILNPKWHDRLLLTQFFWDAFEAVVDVHRIAVAVAEAPGGDVVKLRTSVRECLALVTPDYRMSWPVRIVISDESMHHYQAIFTFLLQNKRASYVLRKHRFMSGSQYTLTAGHAIYYGLHSRLLWFFDSLTAYLSNLVIAPQTTQLTEALCRSKDVDSMTEIHSTFVKRMRDAACLGNKLSPIRESMLEMMDLAIRLEDARCEYAERHAEDAQELFRLSVAGPHGKLSRHAERYRDTEEQEEESFLQDRDNRAQNPSRRPYHETLSDIRSEFDRHLQFVCGGLRGAARASKDFTASRWDILAEILEVGMNQTSQGPW